ncbi:MAG: phage portal protein [Planctomycetes bacterium]|nr:phage portal protein [Planctomycetota bacterium]
MTDNLLETAWGTLVPWEEYPQNDWPGGVPGTGRFANVYTHSRDRADGRFLPVYETEIDLSHQRAVCRALAQLEGVGVGAIGAMTNYTVGTGMSVTVREAKDQSADAGLLADIKAFVADFLKRNSVIGDLDREVDSLAREDGERILTLNGNARELSIGIVEPDWLTEPRMVRELEDWLECDFPSTWTFGVHRRKGCSDPVGYHVLYEDAADWDYLPASRVEHWKRNVPRTAARGVSDVYPVSQDLSRESKIARNSAAGAAARAAIAWVEELVAGMSQSGAESGAISRALSRSTVTGDQSTVRTREMKPGTAVKVPNGKKYLAGPDGPATEGNLAVAQYLLRRFGVRWSAPEYLISGDASNGNFASTLVAESPFVKAREADQSGHGRRWVSLLWKAIRIRYQAGLFAQWIPWEEIFRTIEIDCEFPDVASRNELQLTQAMVAQRDAGFISDRTASTRLGNDFDQEQQLGARRVVTPSASPFGSVPAMESARGAIGSLLQQEWDAYP